MAIGDTTRPVPLPGSDQQLKTGGAWYYGYIVRAAGAAGVAIYDGTSAAGRLLGQTTLAAAGEQTVALPFPVWAADGIFVDIVSGSPTGSVFIA